MKDTAKTGLSIGIGISVFLLIQYYRFKSRKDELFASIVNGQETVLKIFPFSARVGIDLTGNPYSKKV